ncbi:MAG: hypothetical protein K2X29_11110 [Candidatus Obscuribacterales bacterium]|nr:hypothetical protein [Candidatus Obscuribacterales bacterium]
MDKFEVAAERISDREMCPHDYFVVRAVVNGTIYGEPDYILNIDNFFEALEADEAVIQLIGQK